MEPTTDHEQRLARIAAALDLCGEQEVAAMAMSRGSNEQNAARAARLALVCARKAGWWRALYRASAADPCGYRLYRRAVLIAGSDERDNARFWRDAAADWTARAEHRPTSDAAGSLSNWHELGVTA